MGVAREVCYKKGMADLEISQQGSVLVLTLNRPEARNALSEAMVNDLEGALRDVEAGREIRAVVLTGAGGAFCSGGDVRGMKERMANTDPEARRLRMRRQHRLVKLIHDLERPVIAAVDGVAFGAGFSLALLCDMVVASTRARFCMAFGRIGLIPDYGALYTLPRLVGMARAKELLFSAREVDAQEAQSLGLVLEVVPPEQLMSRAMALAQGVSSASPAAVGMTKNALNRSLGMELHAVLDLEAQGQAMASLTDYHTNAIQRMTAKEPLAFQWSKAVE
jgi:2-(1,2-epoxy-1,2-dihydrophenyl)acetyl-CoA isomerase